MKLVIEVDLEGDLKTNLGALINAVVDSAEGFIQGVGYDPDILVAAKNGIGWKEQVNAGVICESNNSGEHAPVSIRIGYARSNFDGELWNRKYGKPGSRIRAVSYNSDTDELSNLNVETVAPPAVHD